MAKIQIFLFVLFNHHPLFIDIYVSNLICYLVYSPLPPPTHSPLCSVLLWACAAALQTHLKSLSGSNPPPSASTPRLLSLPLDLPLMPQNFLLLLLSDSVCWPLSPEMWLMWLFFSLNVAVKSSNFTCNALPWIVYSFFFYTCLYISVMVLDYNMIPEGYWLCMRSELS